MTGKIIDEGQTRSFHVNIHVFSSGWERIKAGRRMKKIWRQICFKFLNNKLHPHTNIMFVSPIRHSINPLENVWQTSSTTGLPFRRDLGWAIVLHRIDVHNHVMDDKIDAALGSNIDVDGWRSSSWCFRGVSTGKFGGTGSPFRRDSGWAIFLHRIDVHNHVIPTILLSQIDRTTPFLQNAHLRRFWFRMSLEDWMTHWLDETVMNKWLRSCIRPYLTIDLNWPHHLSCVRTLVKNIQKYHGQKESLYCYQLHIEWHISIEM